MYTFLCDLGLSLAELLIFCKLTFLQDIKLWFLPGCFTVRPKLFYKMEVCYVFCKANTVCSLNATCLSHLMKMTIEYIIALQSVTKIIIQAELEEIHLRY